MEHYAEIGSIILAIAVFVPTFIFFIQAAKHFIQMLNHFKSGRHRTIANVIPFLVPFMPKLLTSQGNIHRLGFITNFGWFICCCGLVALIVGLLRIKT